MNLFPLSSKSRRMRYLNGVDANTITYEWVLAKGTNFPSYSGTSFWYIHTFAYNIASDNPEVISEGRQIAYSYQSANVIFQRSCESGTWTAWTQVPTHAEIEAINSKTNVLYNTGIDGSDAATFLKNYLTHVTLPSDLTTVTFGGSWNNVGYVTGIIRKVTASAFNGIMKVSLTTAGTSKEYSFWSWNGTDVYADQIPTRAEIDALNNNLYRTKITSGGISNGASETINIGNGTRGTILCASVSGAGRFIIGYGSNSSGAVDYSVIAGNPGTSVISANTGEISITNNSGAYITWTMITNT